MSENKIGQNQIFIEKYRPNKLDDIIGQEKIIKRLKQYVINKNIPNLLLSGGAGTGKTSSSIALAKELYGNLWSSNFIEINASDDRGIGVVRERIKQYAAVQSIGDVEFKIVFLDESDALTSDAQGALRRTMEQFTNSCRFILSCNYSSKIIEPIQSRCAVYRFRKIDPKEIINRCKYITTQENIKIEPEALEAIAYIADGDCRKGVQLLETSKLTSKNNLITIQDIYESSSFIEPKIITDIIKNALSNKFFIATNQIEDLIMDGLAAEDILKQMMTRAMEMSLPSERINVELVDIIGECDWRISEGMKEIIAFKQMIAKMVKLGSLV